MGESIQIKDLTFRYRKKGKLVLDHFNMEVTANEILSLVGPSGCGKSSLLRLIAGLERPVGGEIRVNGNLFSDATTCLAPERRKVGMVSQSGDLFPHLTVCKNIAYGIHRQNRAARRQRVQELLQAIELPDISHRYPSELSGGEAQRVALARALAPAPGILLLDEPFSSLDSELRERLRLMTATLLRDRKTTAIFVTHHREDALATGDRIVRLS